MPDPTNATMMAPGHPSAIRTTALPMLVVLGLVAATDIGLDLAWVATGAIDLTRYLYLQVGMWWAAWLFLFPVMVALVVHSHPERHGWLTVVAGHALLGILVALTQAWIAALLFLVPGVSAADSALPVFLTLAERFGAASYAIYLTAIGASLAHRHFLRASVARVSALEAEQEAAALQSAVASAALEELSSSLPPQFVSNAFAGVAHLIRSGRSDDAVRMIAALGDLLRNSMPREGRRTSLRTELEDMRRYLDVELRRFTGAGATQIRVAPELGALTVNRLALRPFAARLARELDEATRNDADLVIEATTDIGGLEARVAAQFSGRPAITYSVPVMAREMVPEMR